MILCTYVDHYLFAHPEHLKLCIKNKQATLKTFIKPTWAVSKVIESRGRPKNIRKHDSKVVDHKICFCLRHQPTIETRSCVLNCQLQISDRMQHLQLQQDGSSDPCLELKPWVPKSKEQQEPSLLKCNSWNYLGKLTLTRKLIMFIFQNGVSSLLNIYPREKSCLYA